jgi:hypothetical protein
MIFLEDETGQKAQSLKLLMMMEKEDEQKKSG